MSETIAYLDPPYTVAERPLPWQKGLTWTASGYGRKIPSRYVLTVQDHGRRQTYRVYAACWSNAASYYVLRGGVQRWLRDHELQAARDAGRGTNA